MRMFDLGQTGLKVSELCLGTMTYGTQTSEADAHQQIDLCLSNNINFIDTAEMYPVNPISAETVGRSEEIIGRWISANKNRSCLLYTSPSPRDATLSRMPSSA